MVHRRPIKFRSPELLNPLPRYAASEDGSVRVLWEDGERVLCRTSRESAAGGRSSVLAVLPASEHPAPGLVDRFVHEYGLRDQLDGPWAIRPLELEREHSRNVLVLEDPGGDPLARLLEGRS